MKHDAILRTTQAIRDRLLDSLTRNAIPNKMVFIGPLDDSDARSASLILFLYRLTANPELRNSDRYLASEDGAKIEAYSNSLPLNLHYILTVGTVDGGPEEQPLLALGAAIQELQHQPTLFGASTKQENVRVSMESLSAEDLSRIWALFPAANYRTSVAYVATPVWIDPEIPTTPATPVRTDELASGSRVGGAGS